MPLASPTLEPLSFLYIEDDVALAHLVRKAFERRGHSFAHVETGAEAVTRLSDEVFDAVALDHSLTAETGFDVLARLGPRNERPPVIYVTAENDARLAIDALKRGADDYLVKEVSQDFLDLLVVSTEQAVERTRLRRHRNEAQRQVSEARDRAELLLREVNHRVANSLGLVASVVRLQANALKHQPEAVKALQETQARISAVAGVHRHLYTSDAVGTVRLEDYLGQLVCDLAQSLNSGEQRQIKTEWQRPITVSTDAAVSIGVIVCELITNAIKYAYPEGLEGDIVVQLRDGSEPDSFEVAVMDWGVGFCSDGTGAAKGTGLGSRIMHALADSLKASVRNSREGGRTEAVLAVPISPQGR